MEKASLSWSINQYASDLPGLLRFFLFLTAKMIRLEMIAFFGIVFLFASCGNRSELNNISDHWHSLHSEKTIRLPYQAKTADVLESPTGEKTAIYIKKVKPDPQIRNVPPPVFYLRRTSDRVALYVNQEKIGDNSTGSIDAPFYTPVYLQTPSGLWKPGQTNTLKLVLKTNRNYPLDLDGRMWMSYDPAVLRQFVLETEMIQTTLLSIYAIAGLYFILLYFYNREDHAYLYFGFFALLLSGHWYFNTMHRDYLFHFDLLLRSKIQHITLYLAVPAFNLFLSSLFNYGLKYAKALMVPGIAFSAATLFLPGYDRMGVLLEFYYPFILLSAVHAMAIAAIAYKNRVELSRSIIVGALVLSLSAVHDIALDLDWIESIRISDYSFALPVVGMATLLSARFARNRKELKKMNTELEDRVEKRTLELSESLSTIQKMKELQDADYYLTSLLFKPLAGGNLEHSAASIRTYLKQKCSIRFRKWDVEIGGDIAAANIIQLKDKQYMVFLNADAMGKSIQGAGGAIVLGTTFKSKVSRTQAASQRLEDPYPERWLKDFYKELQSLFIEFEGGMTATAIAGLLDLQGGTLYTMNLEHPSAVLLRDGNPVFLFPDQTLCRLGLDCPDSSIKIQVTRLLPGDLVVMGSDGRDDLITAVTTSGDRRMNEDESLFLEAVQKGHGIPEQIVSELATTGSLSDDLVISSIHYRGVEDSLPEVHSHDENTYARAMNQLKQGNLKKARDLLLRHCSDFPWDTPAIFTLSQLYLKTNEIERAIDEIERCYLRKPESRKIIELRDKIYKKRDQRFYTSRNNPDQNRFAA